MGYSIEDSVVTIAIIFAFLFIVSKSFRKALGWGLGLIFAGIIFFIIIIIALRGGF